MNKMQQIKAAAARNLVNYSGLGLGAGNEYGMVKRGGYFGYDGSTDEFVNFDGDQKGSNFANEVNTHRSFQFTFDTSTATADFEVILFPSIYPSSGVLIAGDGAVGGGVTGFQPVTFNAAPTPLRFMQEWVKHFPSRVTGLKINSTNQLQHGTTLDLYPKNPWRKATQPRTIFLEHHTNEYKNQLTLSTIKEQFQLDGKTELRMKLMQDTVATVTIFFGAVMDNAEALRKKAQAAGADA